MEDDQGDDFRKGVLEGMALYLMALGTDDNGEKNVELSRHGNLAHLRVMDSRGELALHVVGKDSQELGRQLALACLQNVSIEHLGALHLQPLNKPVQLQKGRS